jgi:hypothetical protein
LKNLRELSLVPSAATETEVCFLAEFLGEIQAGNRRRLEKAFATSVLPSLVGVKTVVDFRAVRKPDLEPVMHFEP